MGKNIDKSVLKEYLQAQMLKAAAEDICSEAEEKLLDQILADHNDSGDEDND